MEANQFSKTALVTAYIRAYHTAYDEPKVFDDFMAHRLITVEGQQALQMRLIDSLQLAEPELARSYFDQTSPLPWWVRVIAGAVLSRARYAEDCLEQAIRAGRGST